LAVIKKKGPNMAAREWFSYWDNALVHTAAIVKDWMAAKDFRLIEHQPYSLTLLRRTSSFPEYQKAAGRQNADPGDLQVHVGGGHQNHCRRGLCCRLPALVRVL
jgi:hypothetical protein